jgi:hypothetical protein
MPPLNVGLLVNPLRWPIRKILWIHRGWARTQRHLNNYPERALHIHRRHFSEVSLSAPAAITYGTAFPRLGAHLHIAHSGDVVMRIRPIAAK